MLTLLERMRTAIATHPEIEKTAVFLNDEYQRQNHRRREHLASLHLPIAGKSVLEVGAGIGEHTGFFLDRGCRVTVTDGRPENLLTFALRCPEVTHFALDIETADSAAAAPHDIVFAYGLLYHLSDPARALRLFSQWSKEMLLLETCVSVGDGLEINLHREDQSNDSQAVSGLGCRPTRAWIVHELKQHFAHVYVPVTQPAYPEFLTDWEAPATLPPGFWPRAVFVASHEKIDSPWLTTELLMHQGI
jgi:hypothetical protein